ncbi:ferric reductase NAD binding domain-containing protein [Ilyonectria sp. MPI-CAGE-AT-0026]|nr:ferric reductase NAD binding domain-containing protein [Ilyonectria sp. MPI-CAGE-AT-0026]
MAAANMALCVFFGLKNTPLALVTATSHTQINTLHRVVGYTAAFLVLLHAIFYTIHFGRAGRWATLIEADNIAGVGSGVGMIILLMGIFRDRGYEMFYLSHIAGFLFAAVLTGLHRPDWAKKLPVVMLFTACIWALDRMIRVARMSYNLFNNEVTFHPLPGGGTRLLLKKTFIKAALPGSHCFLWIPHINFYQTHPFTIVNNDHSGLELVIQSREGFTKAVSEFATQHPGRTTRVSFDGPYGCLPETAVYDKLILVAGGSGAAFTFGLMNRILNHSERITIQSIDFVWAVKYTEQLSWYSEHLHNLTRLGSNVNVTLYVTSEDLLSSATSAEQSLTGSEEIHGEMETALSTRSISNYEEISETGNVQGLLSEAACKVVERVANVRYKKMRTETVIREGMQEVGSHQRALIAACGPKSLMDAVRDSGDSCRSKLGHWVDVHCEDFSS